MEKKDKYKNKGRVAWAETQRRIKIKREVGRKTSTKGEKRKTEREGG